MDAASKVPSVLIVDDDPVAIHTLDAILGELATTRFATNGTAALRFCRDAPPDLILLDAEMPGLSGFDVCTALKAHPATHQIPVIFVTGHHGPELEVTGFSVGAVDFITKPFSAPVVVARVKTHLRVKQLADELRRVASTDALTGVANRRTFDEALEREWRRCARSARGIALALVDVDHFKRYNDRHGHPSGDVVLRAVAGALVATCRRPGDLVARIGGEEFAILLPETPPEGALHVGEALVAAVSALRIPHEDSPSGPFVTISVGVATHERRGDSATRASRRRKQTAADLVRTADAALYDAKRAGRACVRITVGLPDTDHAPVSESGGVAGLR